MQPLPGTVLKSQKMTQSDDLKVQAIWKDLHDEEASWSSNSRHQLVPDSTHYIQFVRPDTVIAAVREVVDTVRGDQPVDFAQRTRNLAGSQGVRCTHDGVEGSGASADPRRAKCRARLNDVSGKGDRPFALEGPSSETAIGLTQHELPLPNPMGELDTGDRDRGSGK
jgi:hypothetical protein